MERVFQGVFFYVDVLLPCVFVSLLIGSRIFYVVHNNIIQQRAIPKALFYSTDNKWVTIYSTQIIIAQSKFTSTFSCGRQSQFTTVNTNKQSNLYPYIYFHHKNIHPLGLISFHESTVPRKRLYRSVRIKLALVRFPPRP